ncbi:MAG: 6,7-dimethyl-8-ribityllumazine synthase [Actinobacteria bacterium]|nr:6,7-dimethyl-8-ribityllumazine synthase [Actinomycetota bacterium]
MSGDGAPRVDKVEGAEDLRVAVIASSWHEQVMDGLLDGARRALKASGVRESRIVRVPGTFELPVAASRLTLHGGWEALVALGVVIRGGTPHFDYVCQAATIGLTSVAERTGVPIGFGVLTCDDEAQALDRAGLTGSSEDKGFEAATAALQAAVTLAPYRLGLPL